MIFRNDAQSFNENLIRENTELKEKLQRRRERSMGLWKKILAVVVSFISCLAVFWLWSLAGRLVSSASNEGVLLGFVFYCVIVFVFGVAVYGIVKFFSAALRKNNDDHDR